MGDGSREELFVPFGRWSREIGMYHMDGQPARKPMHKVKGKVITGTGYGRTVVVLVHTDLGGGKTKSSLDVYEAQMAHVIQSITVELADGDEAYFVDISRCDTRLAVLSKNGWVVHPSDPISHATGQVSLYATGHGTQHWSQHCVLAAYSEGNIYGIGSVKFDITGDRIVTAARGLNEDSALKVFDFSDGKRTKIHITS
jgi:hypothetical protein